MEALLKEADRAARSQRAEFANRSMADLLRADRKRKQAQKPPKPPTQLQRAVEAPPPWHSRRLPSRLARADLLLGLDTPTSQRAKRAPEPRVAAIRMRGRVRASTLRSCVGAWRPFWNWWTATGEEQLPKNSEEVLVYLEHRAAEPCAPSVLRRLRAALAFNEEVAGRTTTERVSRCPWLCKQADALEGTLVGSSRGQARQNSLSLPRGSKANSDCHFEAGGPQVLCILALLGSLGGAEICISPRAITWRLHPHRRCPPWDTLQNQNHRKGQESSITRAPRKSKLLTLGSCVDASRLRTVENSSTVGQRLFSPGPRSEVGTLGKIRFPECCRPG